MAKYWRKESIEEMEHADKLIERIIFLDGFPNMQVSTRFNRPEREGRCSTATSRPRCRRARSTKKRRPTATACATTSRDLFEKLMHAEEEHIDFLETQLALVATVGIELYPEHMGKLESDAS